MHFERMKNKLQKESETEKSGGSEKIRKTEKQKKQLSGAWPEVTIVATSDHCGQKLPFRDFQENQNKTEKSGKAGEYVNL